MRYRKSSFKSEVAPLITNLEEKNLLDVNYQSIDITHQRRPSLPISNFMINHTMIDHCKQNGSKFTTIKGINTLIRMHLERLNIMPKDKLDAEINDNNPSTLGTPNYKKYTLDEISKQSKNLIKSFDNYSNITKANPKRRLSTLSDRIRNIEKRNIKSEEKEIIKIAKTTPSIERYQPCYKNHRLNNSVNSNYERIFEKKKFNDNIRNCSVALKELTKNANVCLKKLPPIRRGSSKW